MKFNHEVGANLAGMIPESVRDEPERCKDWVNRALEIGLRAMLSGSGSVDLSFVSRAFNDWINDSGGSFQKAFNLQDPNSPLSKFMSQQTTDREDHESSMKDLVEEIKGLVIKDAAPKQAKQVGDNSEDAVEVFLTNIKNAEDKVTRTGEEAIKGSGGVKKGDVGVLIGHPIANDLLISCEVKGGESASAYTLKGRDSLWNQMSKAMKTRQAKAAIGVVNIKNVKKHKPWLENGRYQIVVAVDFDNMDFTLLEIAFSILRYRLIEDISTKDSAKTEPKLDVARFEALIKDILANTDIAQTMRTNLSKIGSIIDNQDRQVTEIERKTRSQVSQLRMLLAEASQGGD